MVRKIFMQKMAYPNEKVLLWAATSQEVKEYINRGDIPQMILPNELSLSDKPKIAIILAQDKHPDRAEKDYTVFPDYVDAVVENGGYPVFIGYDKVEEQLNEVNPKGILLLGGNFRLIKQRDFGYEPRPQAYITMIEYARRHKMPLFAICGGEQMLSVYFGADVDVNINGGSEKNKGHMQPPYRTSHRVLLKKNSQIHKILKKPFIEVNSCHRTAVSINEKSDTMLISGVSDDGVVEAVEMADPWNKDFIIGVQWHPERLAKIGDDNSKKLFRAFVNAAKSFSKKSIR